jgi:hypothetical protein
MPVDSIRVDDDCAFTVRDTVEPAGGEQLHAAARAATAVQDEQECQRLPRRASDVRAQASLPIAK